MSGPRIAIVGLGPAGLERVSTAGRFLLLDEARTVVLRTLRHPAAEELAAMRRVSSCDDLYDSAASFDEVYAGITERVLGAASAGPVTYAVPGSAAVGERVVGLLLDSVTVADEVAVWPGESFLELAAVGVGIDPIVDGLQVLDGRDLPEPLSLQLPTFVTQVDGPMAAAEVAVSLGRLLPPEAPITVLDRLGDADAGTTTITLDRLSTARFGPRTTLFVPAGEVGWPGLVTTNRLLRSECPWDAQQTHHTLVSHLVEEAYETVDAISSLSAEAPDGDTDFGAYAALEEELGDLLLQVVFHATLAREAGAFDFDEVAEGIRRKLVARHPHVFGEVVVDGSKEVRANWERLKTDEKGRASLMDDVPRALPAVARAHKIQGRAHAVGFDWPSPEPVFDKVAEELDELRRAGLDQERRTSELGDLLFAVINLSRHLGVDAELALDRANDTFAARFRTMEAACAASGLDLRSMSPAELDERWEQAKRTAGEPT